MTKSAVIIENRFDVSQAVEAHQRFLPPNWEVVHYKYPIRAMQDYNNLLVSKDFWASMTDRVLIFQHDSVLLREGIDYFLEWDYIGAPIAWMDGIMNGGLSLRSRDAMLKVIEHVPYDGVTNEDIYFCNGLRQIGANMPDFETAKRFSVETVFYEKPIGCHAIEKYLTQEQCQHLLKSA